MSTVGRCVTETKKLLKKFETRHIDAEIIVAHATGLTRSELYIRWEDDISDQHLLSIQQLVERRNNNEPIAYLIKERAFWKDNFIIDNKVLVPRCDSEAIIELTLTLLVNKNSPIGCLDLGVGSGCILVSLLKEYPKSRVVGVDISQSAIITTRKNCIISGVANRARLHLRSWEVGVNKKFDLIVCNPPYVRSADVLDLDTRHHEPIKALNGGISGLDKFREVFSISRSLLRRRGILIFEIGKEQKIEGMAKTYGFHKISAKRDLQGIKRAIAFRKNGAA